MKKILVTMQHKLTMDQLLELGEKYPNYTIETLEGMNPSLFKSVANCSNKVEDLLHNAVALALLINSYEAVILPIGSPAFNYLLSNKLFELKYEGAVLFAHSERVSVEKVVNGTVVKTNEFKHINFIKL